MPIRESEYRADDNRNQRWPEQQKRQRVGDSPVVADVQGIVLQAEDGVSIRGLRSQYSGDHDSSGQRRL
ncbi:hypothetical protein D3C73_1088530 [compost metagenome]